MVRDYKSRTASQQVVSPLQYCHAKIRTPIEDRQELLSVAYRYGQLVKTIEIELTTSTD